MIGVVVGYEGLLGRWLERLGEFGVATMETEEGMPLVEYLGKKQQLDTVECNNMVREFCWATQLIAE